MTLKFPVALYKGDKRTQTTMELYLHLTESQAASDTSSIYLWGTQHHVVYQSICLSSPLVHFTFKKAHSTDSFGWDVFLGFFLLLYGIRLYYSAVYIIWTQKTLWHKPIRPNPTLNKFNSVHIFTTHFSNITLNYPPFISCCHNWLLSVRLFK
jgi:hypothetical protein